MDLEDAGCCEDYFHFQIIDVRVANGRVHITGVDQAGEAVFLGLSDFSVFQFLVPKKANGECCTSPMWENVLRDAAERILETNYKWSVEQMFPLCGYYPAPVWCLRVYAEPGDKGVHVRLQHVIENIAEEEASAVDGELLVIDEHSCEQQFYYATKVRPSSWAKVLKYGATVVEKPRFLQISTRLEAVSVSDIQKPAPAMMMVFDIECNSESFGFPDAELPDDRCEQIGIVLQDVNESCGRKYIMLSRISTRRAKRSKLEVSGEAQGHGDAPALSVDYECFGGNEKAMLLRFVDIIKDNGVVHIVAHNGLNFDIPFLVKRAQHLKIDKAFLRMSIFNSMPCRFQEREIQNNQLGAYKIGEIDPQGIVVHDTLIYFRKAFSLSSYSLNALGEHFLGGRQKLDMPPKKMFRLFQQKFHAAEDGPRLLEDVAIYCLVDTILTIDLVSKVKMIHALYGLSAVTCTKMHEYIVTGEQRKSYAVICQKAMEKNYFINKDALPVPPESYQGATVLPPSIGLHLQPILGLDFASLYPSIMQAYNLCFSTCEWLKDAPRRAPGLTDDQRDIYRHTIKPYGQAETEVSVSFVKKEVREGLLPMLLAELLDARKGAKKKMKDADNAFDKMIYDQLQRAFKITCNAIYGFCGVQGRRDPDCAAFPGCCGLRRDQKRCQCYRGMLSNCFVAQTVTQRGRRLIDETAKHVLEKWPDAQIVYGDTDSCYVKPNLPPTVAGLKQAMTLGGEMAAYITDKFPKPVLLEFEKVMWPFLQKAKKRYISVCYEDLTSKPKRDAKGVELVRRDNSEMLRNCYREVFEALLPLPDLTNDACGFDEAAINENVSGIVRRHLTAILNDDIPAEQYVISKQLAASYKSTPLHRVLADTIKERVLAAKMTCDIPMPGDRVSFVIVLGPDEKKLMNRAEDPSWQREHGPPIDRLYYTKQLSSAICGITETVLNLEPDFNHVIAKIPRLGTYRAPNQRSIVEMLQGPTAPAPPPPRSHVIPKTEQPAKKKLVQRQLFSNQNAVAEASTAVKRRKKAATASSGQQLTLDKKSLALKRSNTNNK